MAPLIRGRRGPGGAGGGFRTARIATAAAPQRELVEEQGHKDETDLRNLGRAHRLRQNERPEEEANDWGEVHREARADGAGASRELEEDRVPGHSAEKGHVEDPPDNRQGRGEIDRPGEEEERAGAGDARAPELRGLPESGLSALG